MAQIPTSPPCNVEAESAVLGAFLIDPDGASQQVNGYLKPAHFYLKKHTLIYSAVQALRQRDEPVDMLTLATELETRGKLKQIGGAVYLSQLVSAVPSAINVYHYAESVHDTWRRREVLRLLSDVSRLAYNESSDLGDAADPSGVSRKNLPLAKQTIDIMSMIEEKTRGNRTDEEDRLLSEQLYTLRLRYVELNKGDAA